jgi:HK97 gp10 family phage protein
MANIPGASSSMRMMGLEGVVEALRALPTELSGRNGGPVRGALWAATKLIRDAARDNAPVGEKTPMPGNLRRQIYAYRDRNPRARGGAAERYIVSVRKRKRGKRSRKHEKFGAPAARNVVNIIGGDAYYWMFVEFGTVKQPPQAFMRRAFETNKVRAVNEFTAQLRRSVDKAVQRAKNKGRGRR